MTEIKKVYNQRLVDAEIKTTPELHPRNRNGEQSLDNFNKFSENEKKIRKKCFGCLDNFTCSQPKNYDYCKNCTLNGSRYIPSRFTPNKCSECGDGSGLIKFLNQPPRSCKLCYLTNQKKREENIFAK